MGLYKGVMSIVWIALFIAKFISDFYFFFEFSCYFYHLIDISIENFWKLFHCVILFYLLTLCHMFLAFILFIAISERKSSYIPLKFIFTFVNCVLSLKTSCLSSIVICIFPFLNFFHSKIFMLNIFDFTMVQFLFF